MDETLRQLGGLLLGAVPTVILLTLLYILYTAIVHKPLRRVLDQRRNKTEGAVEKSRADIAAAEARTSEYEQRLREELSGVLCRCTGYAGIVDAVREVAAAHPDGLPGPKQLGRPLTVRGGPLGQVFRRGDKHPNR